MSILDKLSLKSRFFISLSIFLIIFFFFAVYSLISMRAIERKNEAVLASPFQVRNSSFEIHKNFLQTEKQLVNLIINQDNFLITNTLHNLKELETLVYTNFNKIEEITNNNENLIFNENLRSVFNTWVETKNNIIHYIMDNDIDKAIALYNENSKKISDELTRKLDEFNEYVNDRAKKVIDEGNTSLNNYQFNMIIFIIVMLLLFFILAFILSKSLNHSISFFNKTLSSISLTGNLDYITLSGNNEINSLAKDFNKLIDNIGHQKWIREGINLFTKELSGYTSIQSICEKAVSFTARYIEAVEGELYIYDRETDGLRLASQFANSDKNIAEKIRLGEGIVGQVALEKAPMTLTLKKSQEEQHPKNDYGTNTLSPKIRIYQPLIFKDELVGVVEYGFFLNFNKMKQTFIAESSNVISSYLFILSQREKLEKADKEKSKAYEKLERINEELEEAYEELERNSKQANQFLQSAQDALTAHIAILDENGVIIVVNEAWKKFAENNKLTDNDYSIGKNYLEVCDSAKGKDSEEASIIAKGLRDVMSGEKNTFNIEYPCHSPTEKRWFTLRVTSFSMKKAKRYVIAHENITVQKLKEEEILSLNVDLINTNRELKRLKDKLEASDTVVRNFPNGAVVLFDKDLRYILYRGENQTQKDIESIEGKTIREALPKDTADYLEPYYRKTLAGHTSELEMFYKDDYYKLHFIPIRNDKGEITSGLLMSQIITKIKLAENKLRETKDQIQSILDNSPSIIFIKDTEGKYILVNKQFEKLFNTSSDFLKGKTDFDVFEKEFARKFGENDEQVVISNEPINFEEDLIYNDETYYYLTVKFPLKNSEDNVYGVCGIATDVTESRKLQEELKQNYTKLEATHVELSATNEELEAMNEEYETSNQELMMTNRELEEAYFQLEQVKKKLEASDIVVRNFPNGAVILYDKDLRYIVARGKGLNTVDLESETMEGKLIWEIFPKETCDILEPYYKEALKGVVSEFEMDYDNNYYKVYTTPIRDEDGNITAGLAMTQDITKIKKMTEQLRLMNGKRAKALQKLKRTNEQLRQIDEDRIRASKILETQNKELEEMNKELQKINLERKKAYEKNEVLIDMNEKLERINKERAKALEEMRKLKNKLEKSNEYKSKFLANMSHELRTPLNAIISLSELMEGNRNKNLGIDDIKKARVINESGYDLLNLINNILDISKIEAGKTSVEVTEFPVSELLDKLEGIFEHQAEERNIEFLVKDETNASIKTDKGKLAQILKNLLSNAFKFTDKGSVKLIASIDENNSKPIKISVSDTGISIPESEQERIFENFYQIDSSNDRKFTGTGLGLAITKQLTSLLGGDIGLESKKDVGSTFTVRLPMHLDISEYNNDYDEMGVEDDKLDNLEKSVNNLELNVNVVESDLNREKENIAKNKVYVYKKTDSSESNERDTAIQPVSHYLNLNKTKFDVNNYYDSDIFMDNNSNIIKEIIDENIFEDGQNIAKLSDTKIVLVDDNVKDLFQYASSLENLGLDYVLKALNIKNAQKILEDNDVNALIVSGETLLSGEGFYQNLEKLRDVLDNGDIPIFIFSYINEMKHINKIREKDKDDVLNVKEYLTKPLKPSTLLNSFIKHFFL